MSSETKSSSSTIFGVVVVIASLVGIISVALNWLEISSILGGQIGCTGLDLYDLSTLGIDVEDFEVYIPVVIAVLSVISLIFGIGAVASKGGSKLGIGSAIIGAVVIVLAIIAYLWINDGDEYLTATPSIGLYLAMASGVIVLIFGLLSARK